MRHILNPVVVVIIISVFSCQLSENEKLEETLRLNEELRVTAAKNDRKESEAPGVMPSDHKLLLMIHEPDKYGWNDYYQFLKNELNNEVDKHYYTNLQWINMSQIVKARDFADAPSAISKELWDIISDRKFINEPEVAYTLLNKLKYSGTLNEVQVANLAKNVMEKNKTFFEGNPEGWKQTYESNFEGYQKLMNLTCDRWGLPFGE